jgi:hypothetical protein
VLRTAYKASEIQDQQQIQRLARLKQRSPRSRSSPEPEKPTEGRNLAGPTEIGLHLGDEQNSFLLPIAEGGPYLLILARRMPYRRPMGSLALNSEEH